MILSILSVVAILGFASAVITLYPATYSADIQQGSSSSFTFKIYNDGSGSANNYTLVNITSNVSNLVGSPGTISSSRVSVGAMPSFIANQTNSSDITVSIAIPSSQAVGIYTGNITIGGKHNETGAAVADKLITLSINITPMSDPITCAYGNVNDNLRIKKIAFTNNGFSGSLFGKSDAWFPLDEIEVEITVENRGEEKIEDIELEWGLYDPSSQEWVIEVDDEDTFDLKSEKSEILNLKFILDDNLDVDLEDIQEGDYLLYVKATGYDNEFEEDICVISSKETEIIIEEDFVVLSDLTFSEVNTCGSSISLSTKVWNIGEDDQEDVYLIAYSKDLGINQRIIVGDVDAFDYKRLNAYIDVPTNVAEGIYNIKLSVYDDNDDIYESEYGKDESSFPVLANIKCTSGGINEDSKAVVSANLVSGGKAGEDMIIRSTITNLEDKSMIYTVGAAGYSEWASSASVDTSTFALGAGESNSVLLNFKVKDTAEGENFFNIELYADGKLVSSQPVSVSIDKKGFSFPQLGENKYLWGMALVNIILILVIIIVAIRVLRK